MPDDTARPTVETVETLLAHPGIVRHLEGLKRLRVAVNPEAGEVSGHGRLAGTELVITGPVDAETAEEAFHLTRVIPREEGHLRIDFSYPRADLWGRAELDAGGRVIDLDVEEG